MKKTILLVVLISNLSLGRISYSENLVVDSNYENDIIIINEANSPSSNVTLLPNSQFTNNGIIKNSYSETLDGEFVTGENKVNSITGDGNVSNEGYINTRTELSASKISSEDLGNSLITHALAKNVILNNGVIHSNYTGISNGKISIHDSDANTSSSSVGSGNGISTSLTELTNNGVILGNSNLIAGESTVTGLYSLYLSISASTLSNYSGNGALLTTASSLSNAGVISGYIKGTGGIINVDSSRYGLSTSPSVVSHIVSSGNGVANNAGNTNNLGIIVGKAEAVSGSMTNTGFDLYSSLFNSYIGTSGNGVSNAKVVNNLGVISGFISSIPGTKNGEKGYEEILRSGSGIHINTKDSVISNLGVIKGSQSAITSSTSSLTIDNYGVMAGREIYSNGQELIKNDSSSKADRELVLIIPSTINEHGIQINLKDEIVNGKKTGKVQLDSNGDVIIENIENGSGDGNSGKNILNATVSGDAIAGYDSYENIASNSNFDNHIINGAGIKNGTLNILNNAVVSLSDSIVNAYKTAVTLYDSATLNATNTIFNGGGLKNEDPVIVALEKDVKINLNENSIVNGNVLLKESNSTITIDNSAKVNGDILSELSGANNKVQLGTGTSEQLNIYGNIKNFSNVGITGSVTLFETAKINTGDININNGKLLVRIDGTEKDSEGRVIGHSLYGHNGKITVNDSLTLGARGIDSGASLIFKASGLGVGTIIALRDDQGNVTDISSLTNKQLGTYSLVHTATKKDTGNILIDVENWDDIIEDIIEDNSTDSIEIEDEEEIGEIYDSIKNSGQIADLAPTTDLSDGREGLESLTELVSLLDQIYANNPYSYGGLMSKYSFDMFREGIYSSSDKLPEVKEYLSTGQALYSYNQFRDIKETNTFGKEQHNNKYSSTSNTSGLLGTLEYGIKNNESIGFAIGGAKQKLNMSNNSDLEGDAVYLGAFYKKNVDKFKFITGLGYQHSMYESNRNIYNKYQSFKNEGDFNTNSFNVYGEAKYTLVEDKGIKVEPKIRVSYTHVKQDSVKEKNSKLAIDVDKTDYNYIDTEVGVDLTKEIPVSKGKVKVIANVGYVNSQGTSNKDITGRMKNSTDFGIKGQLLNENNGKAGITVEYEKDNGLFYSVGADLTYSSQNQRNVNARVGIGYKF